MVDQPWKMVQVVVAMEDTMAYSGVCHLSDFEAFYYANVY